MKADVCCQLVNIEDDGMDARKSGEWKRLEQDSEYNIELRSDRETNKDQNEQQSSLEEEHNPMLISSIVSMTLQPWHDQNVFWAFCKGVSLTCQVIKRKEAREKEIRSEQAQGTGSKGMLFAF